jgi:hypothetical protein
MIVVEMIIGISIKIDIMIEITIIDYMIEIMIIGRMIIERMITKIMIGIDIMTIKIIEINKILMEE